MKGKWIYALLLFSFMLGSLLFSAANFTIHFIRMQEWLLTCIFGRLFVFFLWATIKIFQLSRTPYPTKVFSVPEIDGYTIYAINEWSGNEKKIVIPYEAINELFIVVWTNRGFKGKPNDIVGARYIIHYTIQEQTSYFSSIVLDEEVLHIWNERIQQHSIPASITPEIISNVPSECFSTLFETVHTIPFDGRFSIKAFFQQQERLIPWEQQSSNL